MSRLDSLHRTALITTYFPNAGEQTIILSTDSEIDAGYYQLMKENIGDEFTLNYDEIQRALYRERLFDWSKIMILKQVRCHNRQKINCPIKRENGNKKLEYSL